MAVTVNSTKDSYISLLNPNDNHGRSVGFIQIQYSGGDKVDDDRTLVHFDLSATGLTAAQVWNARLVLTEDTWSVSNAPFTVYIRRLTQINWTEAGVTWNKYDGTNAWVSAGGDMTATDEGIDVVRVNHAVGKVWYLSGLAPLVKDAITSRSNQLHIELFIQADTASHFAEWTPRESGTNQWYLEVNYPPIPSQFGRPFHPGKGVSNIGRFYQTRKDTGIAEAVVSAVKRVFAYIFG